LQLSMRCVQNNHSGSTLAFGWYCGGNPKWPASDRYLSTSSIHAGIFACNRNKCFLVALISQTPRINSGWRKAGQEKACHIIRVQIREEGQSPGTCRFHGSRWGRHQEESC
jgi:hypothetical protein